MNTKTEKKNYRNCYSTLNTALLCSCLDLAADNAPTD